MTTVSLSSDMAVATRVCARDRSGGMTVVSLRKECGSAHQAGCRPVWVLQELPGVLCPSVAGRRASGACGFSPAPLPKAGTFGI